MQTQGNIVWQKRISSWDVYLRFYEKQGNILNFISCAQVVFGKVNSIPSWLNFPLQKMLLRPQALQPNFVDSYTMIFGYFSEGSYYTHNFLLEACCHFSTEASKWFTVAGSWDGKETSKLYIRQSLLHDLLRSQF